MIVILLLICIWGEFPSLLQTAIQTAALVELVVLAFYYCKIVHL